MNSNQHIQNFVNTISTPNSADQNPRSAISLALSHAERSYPLAHRPQSPSHAKLYDQEKQRCFIERLRIEKELEQKREHERSAANQIAPAQSAAQSKTQSLPQSEISILKSQIPSDTGSFPNPQSEIHNLQSSHSTLESGRTLENQPLPAGLEAGYIRAKCEPEAGRMRAESELNAGSARATSESNPNTSPESTHSKPTKKHAAPNPGEAEDDPSEYARRRMQDIKDRIAQQRQMEADLELEDAKDVIRARSPMDLLAPSRQRLLYQILCDYSAETVEAVVTLPEPDGWDLDTTRSSLQRFKDRYKRRIHSQRQKESEQLARDILANPDATEQQLDQATRRLFKTRLLDAVNDPAQSPKDIRDYLHAYTRLRALDLTEQRISGSDPKGA